MDEKERKELMLARPGLSGSVLAKWIGERAHAGQTRKFGNKEDYFNHPLRVMRSLTKEPDKIVALLHDTIEDTDLTAEDLLMRFGQEIVDDILAVTRRDGECYFSFIMRLKDASVCARMVKIADLRDNMRDLKEGSMKDKYRFALYVLMSTFSD